MYSNYSIEAVLSRFEERFAVLRNELAGELRWPIKVFPDEIKIGDTVRIEVVTNEKEKQERQENMRQLLEELIN